MVKMFRGVCGTLLGLLVFAIGFLQPSVADQVEGHPVQLFTVDDADKFIFHKEVFTEILGDKITDHKIMIVSIVGAFKEGKSFLMNFFLKYLEFTYNKSSKSSKSIWMGDEDVPLRGFDWKLSQNPTTAGIQTWSKPFCTTLPNGEKVAIILLDTQGLFDGRTPFEVNAKIFALTSIISSVQIYNIKDKIQEDKLILLKFVTDYGAEAAEYLDQDNRAPFQKFLFLIQNWANSHENPYGFEGGKEYLDNFLNTEGGQREEITSIRQRIKSCYSEIACFLNPSPGDKVIRDPNFSGKLSDIDGEYKQALQDLVPALLAPNNIVLKTINGQTVPISKFLEYVDSYVDIMNRNELPRPRDYAFANSESSYKMAFEAAVQNYTKNMEIFLDGMIPYVNSKTLSIMSAEFNILAIEHFINHRKLKNQELETLYTEKLGNEIDQLYKKYEAQNEQNREKEEMRLEREKKEEEIYNLNREKEEIRMEHEETVEQIRSLRKKTEELAQHQNGIIGKLIVLAGAGLSVINPAVGLPLMAMGTGYILKENEENIITKDVKKMLTQEL